jgi:hypothetical protein
MRIGFRHYLLDAQDTLYHVPNAVFDRMLRDPVRHRLPRFASQRIRSAEIAVVLMNGKPIAVERSWFSVLTFKKNDALVSPLADRHVRARAELALALEQPIRGSAVADASTRFLARGGSMVAVGLLSLQNFEEGEIWAKPANPNEELLPSGCRWKVRRKNERIGSCGH